MSPMNRYMEKGVFQVDGCRPIPLLNEFRHRFGVLLSNIKLVVFLLDMAYIVLLIDIPLYVVVYLFIDRFNDRCFC